MGGVLQHSVMSDNIIQNRHTESSLTEAHFILQKKEKETNMLPLLAQSNRDK